MRTCIQTDNIHVRRLSNKIFDNQSQSIKIKNLLILALQY